jgi:uncharacterized phage infection (PIP) family protein YhgE
MVIFFASLCGSVCWREMALLVGHFFKIFYIFLPFISFISFDFFICFAGGQWSGSVCTSEFSAA